MSLPAFTLSQPERLYIGGSWVKPAGARRIMVISPHNEQPCVTVAEAIAIAIANDSNFGLYGAVFTHDSPTAYRVARGVRTGTMSQATYTELKSIILQ